MGGLVTNSNRVFTVCLYIGENGESGISVHNAKPHFKTRCGKCVLRLVISGSAYYGECAYSDDTVSSKAVIKSLHIYWYVSMKCNGI